MNDPVPYHEAVRQAREASDYVRREIHKQQATSPLQVGDEATLIDGEGRTWRLEIEDTRPHEGGARIFAKAWLEDV